MASFAPIADGGGAAPVDPVDTIASDLENVKVSTRDNLSANQKRHLDSGIYFTDPRITGIVSKPILDALTIDLGFLKPSQIQSNAIPRILAGKNFIGQAQPGSGKTIAFTVGILSKIDVSKPTLQALCLVPTRELATQIIEKAIKPLSARFPVIPKWEAALKGVEIERGAKSAAQIVVGTPGTIRSWQQKRYIDFSTIKIFVLDEADEMVGTGQKERELGTETRAIKKQLPADCQMLFFSATYTDQIINFSKQLIGGKATICRLASTESLVLPEIFQVRINVNGRDGKLKVLKEIYSLLSLEKSIVFCNTKNDANTIAKDLEDSGYTCSCFTGELEPAERDRVFSGFCYGDVKVLITTNLLSRGVDVPAVSAVVNYDVPTFMDKRGDSTAYVHRIGRCSRFGRHGTAITLLDGEKDAKAMVDIEEFYNYTPDKRMTAEWSSEDIVGLTDEIDRKMKAPSEEIALLVDDDVNNNDAA